MSAAISNSATVCQLLSSLFLILWTIFNINSEGGGGDGVYFQWQSLVFSLSAAVEIKL